jgi:hypothetical protein
MVMIIGVEIPTETKMELNGANSSGRRMPREPKSFQQAIAKVILGRAHTTRAVRLLKPQPATALQL